jgi:hypothetical protein
VLATFGSGRLSPTAKRHRSTVQCTHLHAPVPGALASSATRHSMQGPGALHRGQAPTGPSAPPNWTQPTLRLLPIHPPPVSRCPRHCMQWPPRLGAGDPSTASSAAPSCMQVTPTLPPAGGAAGARTGTGSGVYTQYEGVCTLAYSKGRRNSRQRSRKQTDRGISGENLTFRRRQSSRRAGFEMIWGDGERIRVFLKSPKEGRRIAETSSLPRFIWADSVQLCSVVYWQNKTQFDSMTT